MAAITTTGTLTAGNSRTFALAPGSALTLTLLPNCRVTVTETPETVSASDAGGNSPRTHNHQLAGVFTYGPYAMGGSVVVANASNSGSTVTWGRKDTVVSTDSTGTSLVSGDGSVIPLTPPSHTWAGKPTPAASGAGTIIRITDIGTSAFGSLWESDGTAWYPLNGRAKLYQNAIPIGIAPSATVAANGSVTFGAALPGNFPNGVWLYFPSGAITTPGGAGFYYCTSIAASTTNFQVTNASVVGAPFTAPPSIPTGFANAVGSAAGFTAPTTELSVLQYTVKGGAMGLSGALRYLARATVTNNANAKNIRVKFGGATLYTSNAAPVAGTGLWASISNRGSAGQQVFTNGTADSAFTSGNSYTAQDTSVDQNVLVTLQLATATDNFFVDSFSLDLEA